MHDDQKSDFAPGELDELIAQAEAQFKRGEGVDADAVFSEIRQMSKEYRPRRSNTRSRPIGS